VCISGSKAFEFCHDLNLWQLPRPQFPSLLNRAQPLARRRANRINLHPAMHRRRVLHFQQPRPQQRFKSPSISPRVVMKRRRNLNQPLQKFLVRFARAKPDGFPRFVRLKKLSRIEKFNPVRNRRFLGSFI
jgi:hypothetical protein